MNSLNFIVAGLLLIISILEIILMFRQEHEMYANHKLFFKALKWHTKCRVIVKDIFSGEELINIAGKLKVLSDNGDLLEISDKSNGIKKVHKVDVKDRSYQIEVEKI